MSGFSGLGKGAGESAFDSGRQILWNEFVGLHAQLDPAMAAGTATAAQLAAGAARVANIINRHKALFAQAQKDNVPTSWLDPRFADYEKPFEQYLNDLNSRAAAGGVMAPISAPVFQQVSDLSTPTQLIISGGNAPAGIPSSAGVSASTGSGGGVFADLFGPPDPVAAPSQGFMGQLGPMLPWIAGGLAVAYFLRKK